MKKLLIPFVALLLSINVYSQRPNKEKVKALKIAHITEQLDLTEKEAQAFWPIYNANEESREKLRESSGLERPKNIENLSEAEARKHLEAMAKMESNRHELQQKYFSKLVGVISAKKTLKLIQAERSFRRKLIEEFKVRHRGERPQRRKN